jgi:hypothetical protein
MQAGLSIASSAIMLCLRAWGIEYHIIQGAGVIGLKVREREGIDIA